MKIDDDNIYDTTIYVVISNSGIILKCFANEENAYSFATRECFKYINITDEISNIDGDENANFTTKLNLIHEKWMELVKTDDDYHCLATVQKYELDTSDMFD